MFVFHFDYPFSVFIFKDKNGFSWFWCIWSYVHIRWSLVIKFNGFLGTLTTPLKINAHYRFSIIVCLFRLFFHWLVLFRVSSCVGFCQIQGFHFKRQKLLQLFITQQVKCDVFLDHWLWNECNGWNFNLTT